MHHCATMQWREAVNCCDDVSRCLSPRLFRALGEPQRVAILAELAAAGGPRTVGELGGCCPVDLSVVSRHLGQLREAGIVDAEKQGRRVLYRVRYTEVIGALRELADTLESCCAQCQPEGDTT